MADESALYALLAADAAVTAIVGTRIYDGQVPTNQAGPLTDPYIVGHVVADTPLAILDGPPGASNLRVQFDLYAPTKAVVRSLHQAVRGVLEAVAMEEGAFDFVEQNSTLRRVSSDWSYWVTR